MRSVTIRSSHGRLTVHAAMGQIVESHLVGDGYANIAFFDPVPIARWGKDLDILAAGFWTREGDYAEPLTMRLTSCRHEMIFEDWVSLRLLPAR